jgi:hypothetical protein
MSESHKGHTPWNKGRTGVYSEETIKKISKSLKGRTSPRKVKKLSLSTGRKTSISLKGKTPWNIGRKKIRSDVLHKQSLSRLGKNHTLETLRKISESFEEMKKSLKEYEKQLKSKE